MSSTKTLLKLVVTAATISCAVLGLAPAYAATTSLPDPSRDGSASLTVHKFAASDGQGEAATGAPLQPEDEPDNPLSGAEFTVYRVDVKDGGTQTNQGWQNIAQIRDQAGNNPTMAQLRAVPGVEAVTQVAVQTTDKSGTAHFGDLTFSLYYVAETKSPEGYFPVAPFLVTVPLTDTKALDSWIYDVNVYPKDRPGPTKEVLDGDAGAPGESFIWRISSPVPAGKLSGIEVRDDLTPELEYVDVKEVSLLDYSQATPSLIKVFQEGTDYRVDTAPTPEGGTKVSVVFLPEGLQYLDGVNSVWQRIAVDLDTICLKAGVWHNTAEVCDTWNYARSLQEEACLETNTVNTKWGQLNILKVDSKDKNLGLAGAEFELYYSHSNDFSTATPTGQTVTTAADGHGSIFPVRYSDWALGQKIDPQNPDYWYYWLVETKAPDGYVLPKGAIPLTLVADGANSQGQFDVEITNVAKEVPGKPGTAKPGGSGALATTGATVVGLSVLAAVALLVGAGMRRRRREQTQA